MPVSIAETPSIMMKVVPPPPIRLMPLTPGASSASEVKLRLAIGRFSTDVGGDREGALPAVRLNDGRLAHDVHGLARAAHLERERPDRDVVADADRHARALERLERRSS